jgi:hypothetical protein
MRVFDAEQRDLIEHVILANWPINRWQLAPRMAMHERAMAMLVAVLDELVRHFDDEIRRDGLAA